MTNKSLSNVFVTLELLKKASDESVSVKIFLSVILSIFMVGSIVGNVCTCAVIARNKNMRTPTNCYLLNLAVTDLLMALFIPLEIYFFWVPHNYPFGEIGCRIHYMLWDSLSGSSCLTISAFTIERYLVITKPFLRQKLALNIRVVKIISIIWIICLLLSFRDLFTIDLMERKNFVYCYFIASEIMRTFVCFDIVLLFIMPMTIISVLYVSIAIKLRKILKNMRNSPVFGKQDREKAVKMLASVAALFFASWSPYAIFRIMVVSRKFRYDEYYNVWRVLYFICSVNVYLSTAGNPILYSLMSRKFRTAFKDLLNGKKVQKSSSSHVSNNTLNLT